MDHNPKYVARHDFGGGKVFKMVGDQSTLLSSHETLKAAQREASRLSREQDRGCPPCLMGLVPIDGAHSVATDAGYENVLCTRKT